MKCLTKLIGVNLFGLEIYVYDTINKVVILEIDWRGKTIYNWRKQNG